MHSLILSAPQIVWKGMNNVKHDIDIIKEMGTCRICGGPIIGSATPLNALDFNSWTDEAFIKNPNSFYICEPCRDIKKNYNKNLYKGFIATEYNFSLFEEAQDIIHALENLPDDPFVLLFKTWGGSLRRHSIYFAPVNYNREQVSALFIFHPWHQPGKTRDDSLSISTMIFKPRNVLELIKQLEEKEDGVFQVNPAHKGPEMHLAAFVVGSKQREAKQKTNKGVEKIT